MGQLVDGSKILAGIDQVRKAGCFKDMSWCMQKYDCNISDYPCTIILLYI